MSGSLVERKDNNANTLSLTLGQARGLSCTGQETALFLLIYKKCILQ